ncbi:MAG: FapA family protein [Lachnospiraceae bacterium]|nr:FapA family protein [Lachnospiraceae bacterium]
MNEWNPEREQYQELHFAMMENAEYQKAQYQEIKRGKEEGLDVSLYSNPEFNWLQMEQIRMGLKDKVDASLYANPAYSYETMRQIRLSLYAGMNLLPYLKRGFTDEDLEEIRFALQDKLSIDDWLVDNMCAPQIHEIRLGLCEQLDVSAYADIRYNWMQMEQIRLGVEKKLDITLYANYLFSHFQMQEIRLGLEAGLDVSSYCELLYSATDMREKRLELLNRKTAKIETVAGTDPVFDDFRKNEFVISVEDNGNKAYAYIPWIPGNIVTKEDIYRDLDRREITYGIKAEAISDLIEKKRMNEKVLIAEGIPAKKGKDGWFEFFVRLDLPRIPAPLADGGVDYVNIEAFEMVEKGEKIAVYHHAEKGRDGKNIYGEVMHGDSGAEKKPLRGVGFEIAPDGVTYRSKMNGKFEYINGRINITNMLVVREDVTAVTGKLEVDGSVYVIGSIYSGGYIKASGDIIIEYNVETARLIAGGNVMIKKGSCSKHDCFIDAGGEVSGSFFEAANINARGNVKANYIMNSNINTMGRVIVSGSKGVLLGGRICAVKGVDTHNLGNSAHLKTVLEVGRNALYEREQALFAEKREQLLNELAMLEKGWNMLLQMIAAKKEVSKEMVSKVHATITVKGQELADLDAEATKLANETDQTVKAPVCVRGNAYGGSVIVINTIKYMLSQEISRVVFRLRNKQVIMVTL